jgi:Flp pilus assembly protein CpaB
MTVKIMPACGGFIIPGSRIDLVIWRKDKNGDEVGCDMMADLLVLANDRASERLDGLWTYIVAVAPARAPLLARITANAAAANETFYAKLRLAKGLFSDLSP